jgi:hypothetical protein
MKKILALIVLSVAMVSCYEEYLLDYPYTAIYFYLQQDVRTFVVGEGMQFKVGATLGGVRENAMDRNVSFTLDNSLINLNRLDKMQYASQGYIRDATAGLAALQLMPTTHYTMSNSTAITIPSGYHTGTITVKADSVAFLNDSVNTCRKSTYVLPFKLTSADADSLLSAKKTNIVGTMFENKLFGNYWHGGAALVNRASNPNPFQRADTTIVYRTTVPTQENLIWTLTTTGPTTLACNGYLNNTIFSGKKIMNLVLKGKKIYLSPGADAPTATFVIAPEGECTFNDAELLQNRKIILHYKVTQVAAPSFVYHCTDTLTFRNRIRDGINEWQDENPDHYSK